jgi:acyl-[acyl-carrier-protein]-phospholipid O-acyltransferase/long-chain-fatty-acid--[acyl-carrier-protein] ligase
MKSLETQAVPERWGRGFWALMFTQAQGAFSDNALKQLVIYLVLALHLGKQEEMAMSAKAGAAFALPFILFSMFGGWLADRCSKRSVMRWVKTAEIGIMLFAAWALASGRLGMQMGAICLMGVHSAIFGPAKYGILPEVLPVSKLSWGNGILELLTFLGIIGGIYAAGELVEQSLHHTGAGGRSGEASASEFRGRAESSAAVDGEGP